MGAPSICRRLSPHPLHQINPQYKLRKALGRPEMLMSVAAASGMDFSRLVDKESPVLLF
jgi:hypothetical protein